MKDEHELLSIQIQPKYSYCCQRKSRHNREWLCLKVTGHVEYKYYSVILLRGYLVCVLRASEMEKGGSSVSSLEILQCSNVDRC